MPATQRKKISNQWRVNPRERALAWLREHSWPRVMMSLMIMLTVGSVFLSTVQLHHLGVKPSLRYPLAVLVGWAVFLGLVCVWVWWQRRRNAAYEPALQSLRRGSPSSSSSSRSSSGGSIGWPGGSGGSGGGTPWHGGGGNFGGAGASESFAAPGESLGSAALGDAGAAPISSGADLLPDVSSAGDSIFSGGGGGGGGGSGGSSSSGIDLDVGDSGDLGGYLILVAAFLLVVVAVFGASFYVVYNAPIFFAELLIDGGVGTWLYRRAGAANQPDWFATAVRRTVWPVMIVMTMFLLLAGAMHYAAPSAMSVGEAFNTWAMSE